MIEPGTSSIAYFQVSAARLENETSAMAKAAIQALDFDSLLFIACS